VPVSRALGKPTKGFSHSGLKFLSHVWSMRRDKAVWTQWDAKLTCRGIVKWM